MIVGVYVRLTQEIKEMLIVYVCGSLDISKSKPIYTEGQFRLYMISFMYSFSDA
jgi:hypothetical protein